MTVDNVEVELEVKKVVYCMNEDIEVFFAEKV